MLCEIRIILFLMLQFNVKFGVMFGEVVKEFCIKYDVVMSDIDLIGLYGQIIWFFFMFEEGEI